MALIDPTPEELRARMHLLREALRLDASRVGDEVGKEINRVKATITETLDWKAHLANHPLLVGGAAFAIGYALMPGKSERLRSEIAALRDELGNYVAARGDALDPSRLKQGSWMSRNLGKAFGLATTFALGQFKQQGLAILTGWLAGRMGSQPDHESPIRSGPLPGHYPSSSNRPEVRT